MPHTPRWGAPAAIAAGIVWSIALAYLVLDELEYAGEIADNPIPGAVGAVGLVLAAIATAMTLTAVRSGMDRDGVGTKTAFGIAYLGTAISLIPLWPAIILGPLLVALGLFLVGIAAVRARRDANMGHRIHAFGLPVVALAAPLLDLAGIMDGSLGLATFGAVLSIGLVWIGLDLNAAQQEPPLGAGAPA